MRNINSTSNKTGWLIRNVFHILWLIFVVTYGFLSFIIEWSRNGLPYAETSVEQNGSFYMICISILAPCVCSLFYKVLEETEKPDNKSKRRNLWRLVAGVFGFIPCTIFPILSQGQFFKTFIVQVIASFFLIGYSFICYMLQFDSTKQKNDKKSLFDDKLVQQELMYNQAKEVDSSIVEGAEVKF